MYALPACSSAIARNAPAGIEKSRGLLARVVLAGPMLPFALDGFFGQAFVLICAARGVVGPIYGGVGTDRGRKATG